MEGICLTAAEDICWTTVVTACLRSEVSQAQAQLPRLADIRNARSRRSGRTDLKKRKRTKANLASLRPQLLRMVVGPSRATGWRTPTHHTHPPTAFKTREKRVMLALSTAASSDPKSSVWRMDVENAGY